jgi:hypothetical protein
MAVSGVIGLEVNAFVSVTAATGDDTLTRVGLHIVTQDAPTAQIISAALYSALGTGAQPAPSSSSSSSSASFLGTMHIMGITGITRATDPPQVGRGGAAPLTPRGVAPPCPRGVPPLAPRGVPPLTPHNV